MNEGHPSVGYQDRDCFLSLNPVRLHLDRLIHLNHQMFFSCEERGMWMAIKEILYQAGGVLRWRDSVTEPAILILRPCRERFAVFAAEPFSDFSTQW